MIVQYIGKRHVRGHNAESGRDYDYVQIHYVKDDPNYDGRCTASKNLYNYAQVKGIDGLIPNQYYVVDCDDNGKFLGFTPAKS